MTATIPIQESDLEFENGTFDSAAFTAKTLTGWQSLAAVIDHALLQPGATRQQVENLCAEAARYRCASVVVNPVWTAAAVSLLAGSGVPVGAVIGFPFGASLVSTLRQEAAALIRLGARELDMVLPIGQLKSGNHHAVHHFLKTSTGFAQGGATATDVALLRGVAGARCGVQASGGICSLADVRAMLEAGANRIGSSASVAILRELGAE